MGNKILDVVVVVVMVVVAVVVDTLQNTGILGTDKTTYPRDLHNYAWLFLKFMISKNDKYFQVPLSAFHFYFPLWQYNPNNHPIEY